MIEIIKSKHSFCNGCNRCVRECPMEASNITYQDEEGNIKVKIDHEKCIACGRCITACKHNARYFEDDTEKFFNDLSKGVPISIIAAPSIRTNIPLYKKLFTYLKSLGVNKIYDVSLGADICIWAHIKNLEVSGKKPIITQPCPVIVSYCEVYHHDLLPRLSPVHSPMACTSIYMQKYQGMRDTIAALSPCVSKSREFNDTNLAQYNITFSNLISYLAKHNIILPNEETQFDHLRTGLGALFPMPGGLKENIEYFLGKNLHIAKAEGLSVYEKLNKYAKTPEEFLPDIFDVLNCAEGCNLGSAYMHDRNIFIVDKAMNDKRMKVSEAEEGAHNQSIFNNYNEILDLSHFIREYKPRNSTHRIITEDDINRAFKLLGKTTFESQNKDCGACGSQTCNSMARKIALNVNIPINCIYKSIEDAKAEHEENIHNHEREKELVSIQEKNELQLTKLNAVVNATKIGLWEVKIANYHPAHPDNIFIWSDEFRYMLGFSSVKDFPNTFESWIDRMHPDDKEEALRVINDHLTDSTGNTPYDVEYRLLRKNNEYAYIRACGEAIRDKNGTAIRIAGAVMDITESKKVLIDTEQKRLEAEEANRAKTIFLSNMSHEMRTPLNAIIGMTTVGKMSDEISRKDDAFNKIEGASKHLLGVINDILDMSKIEANKLELSLVNFNFAKMIIKVADIITPRIQEKKQEFHISIDKSIPDTLIGDDQRLSQVVANLLSNANKFTPNKGIIHLDARLVSEKEGMCRLIISVSDTGIGISNEQKIRLFETFEQADTRIARSFGGTGLGLSISKRIVEMMKGEICVDSEPGEGSTFVFNILLKRGDAEEEKLVNKKLDKDDYTDIFTGKNVLLAEDVEINQEIVIALLEPTQLVVECAPNGEAAVRMFSESPGKYDLIFMDIQMPEMDGYQATRAIRSMNIPEAKKIPIIAMTANVFREDVENCLAAGMNGHVKKPIDFKELIKLLRQYLF